VTSTACLRPPAHHLDATKSLAFSSASLVISQAADEHRVRDCGLAHCGMNAGLHPRLASRGLSLPVSRLDQLPWTRSDRHFR